MGFEDLRTIIEALMLKRCEELDEEVVSKVPIMGMDSVTLNDFILKYDGQDQTKISQQIEIVENIENDQ